MAPQEKPVFGVGAGLDPAKPNAHHYVPPEDAHTDDMEGGLATAPTILVEPGGSYYDNLHQDRDASATDNNRPAGPETTTEKPRLKFVFWEHISKNAAAAAEQVRDCTTIALEFVGLTEKERVEFDTAATAYLSSAALLSERLEAREIIMWHTKGYNAVPVLLEELQDSDIQVRTIDIGLDDPDYSLVDKGDETFELYQEAVYDEASDRIRRRLFGEHTDALAKEHAAREQVVVKQLKTMYGESADPDEVTGILMGAVHTPIYHQLDHDGLPVERMFIAQDYSGERTFHFTSYEALWRQLRLDPSKRPTRAQLKTAEEDFNGSLNDDSQAEGYNGALERIEELYHGLSPHAAFLVSWLERRNHKNPTYPHPESLGTALRKDYPHDDIEVAIADRLMQQIDEEYGYTEQQQGA